MKWVDIQTIAEELKDKFPDIDPKTVRFTDLHRWVMELDGFDDDANRAGEKVLEAIQAAYEMKGPVKMDSVYDALGEENPEPTDAVLEQPAEQPMMGGPGPGAPGEQPPKAAQEFGGLGGEEQVPSEEDQAAALDQAIELDQGQEDYAAATDSQNSNRIPIRKPKQQVAGRSAPLGSSPIVPFAK